MKRASRFPGATAWRAWRELLPKLCQRYYLHVKPREGRMSEDQFGMNRQVLTIDNPLMNAIEPKTTGV